MGLFKKRVKKEALKPKADIIIFEQIQTDEDAYLTNLANQIIEGYPLIFNVDAFDIDGVNKAIAFLHGVVFALEGVIYRIDEKIFLFGPKDTYDDGSVHALLKTLE